MKVISLCDGVSTGLECLIRANKKITVYEAVEIELSKRNLSDHNHPDRVSRTWNDVEKLLSYLQEIVLGGEIGLLPFFDLIIAGPTCTSLSTQGPRTEWEGDSKIFFACAKIVDILKLRNPKIKIFFENVASMSNKCRDDITQRLGLPFRRINAGEYSAQDRVRYYWYNWESELVQEDISPNSLLDKDGLHLFSFSKSNRNEVGKPAIVEGRIKSSGKAGTLTTGTGCRGQSTMNQVITKQMKIRNLTVGECARLQGLGNYTWPCSEAQAFEAIGDGWQADLVTKIFRNVG